MPRRMLRHRAIQQCARLALGISHKDLKFSDNSNCAQINTLGFLEKSPTKKIENLGTIYLKKIIKKE
jgi:hypothetical protein